MWRGEAELIEAGKIRMRCTGKKEPAAENFHLMLVFIEFGGWKEESHRAGRFLFLLAPIMVHYAEVTWNKNRQSFALLPKMKRRRETPGGWDEKGWYSFISFHFVSSSSRRLWCGEFFISTPPYNVQGRGLCSSADLGGIP